MEHGMWRTKPVDPHRYTDAEEIRPMCAPSFFLRSVPPQHPVQHCRRYDLQARPAVSKPQSVATPDSRRWHPGRRAVDGHHSDGLQVEHGDGIDPRRDLFHATRSTPSGKFAQVTGYERSSMQHQQHMWGEHECLRVGVLECCLVIFAVLFGTAAHSQRHLFYKTTDAEPHGSAGATAAASTLASSTALGKKRARYLRDTDRRDIIQRIENGEKQAALAREFGVTRAAICHIKKNHDEIISRYDLVQSAKDLEPIEQQIFRTPEEPLVVREIRTHSALLLLATLRNAAASALAFRRAASRLIMILLEEATAGFSSTPLEVSTCSGDVFQGLQAPSESFCGVSISAGGHSFLKLFRQMEPDAAIGYIHLLESAETAQNETRVTHTDLPPSVRNYNMLLFLATSSDGELVCKSIEAMRRLDVPETNICVVLLLCTADAIAAICSQFPQAKIVTGAVDADARSSLRDFVARYNA